MTIDKIRDYTALVKRRSDIILHSGKSWKTEYENELNEIDNKIKDFRKEFALSHGK